MAHRSRAATTRLLWRHRASRCHLRVAAKDVTASPGSACAPFNVAQLPFGQFRSASSDASTTPRAQAVAAVATRLPDDVSDADAELLAELAMQEEVASPRISHTKSVGDVAVSPPTAPSAVISVFEMFSVGIGPSSSHTVGPMRAAERFASVVCASEPALARTVKVSCKLYGSLALTGIGHGTPEAVMHGLEGHLPRTVPLDTYQQRVKEVRRSERLCLGGVKSVHFDSDCLPLLRDQVLPKHSNGMEFCAYDADGEVVLSRRYYSIGGGFFVTDEGHSTGDGLAAAGAMSATTSHSADVELPPHPFTSSADLIRTCEAEGITIAELAMRNELTWRSRDEVVNGMRGLWQVMDACIGRGVTTSGVLQGGLNIRRRAPGLAKALHDRVAKASGQGKAPTVDNVAQANSRRRMVTTTEGLLYDAVTMWAIAVNEENAAGGRVVTAPTNGAAGVIPAVLKYYIEFVLPEQLGVDDARARSLDVCSGLGHSGPWPKDLWDARQNAICDFLLTAGVVGMLFKSGASISAAEVGCQGEVGVACSMAAGALAAVCGGTLQQVESAAEIGMEHNLGLTCDPIGGLVQVPCIERNVMGAVKAITACRLALSNTFEPESGGSVPVVSLDNVIRTMMATGRDMKTSYKETSLAGLATVVVPVSHPEC